MKRFCALIGICFFLPLLNNIPKVSETVEQRIFITQLTEHIKAQKADAQKGLSLLGWPGGHTALNFFSARLGKGNRVNPHELRFLLEVDYEKCIPFIDGKQVLLFAQTIAKQVEHISNKNDRCDKVYELINMRTSEILFNDKTLSRSLVTEKMFNNRQAFKVQQQFIFGLATAQEVEKLLTKKS